MWTELFEKLLQLVMLHSIICSHIFSLVTQAPLRERLNRMDFTIQVSSGLFVHPAPSFLFLVSSHPVESPSNSPSAIFILFSELSAKCFFLSMRDLKVCQLLTNQCVA